MRTQPVQFSQTDEPLDIRYDPVFKAVFTQDSPASRGALSRLISALIERNVSVLTITANEPPADDIHNRLIRFDINCKTESGESINVEMCFDPTPLEAVRLEYYAAKLFIGQDIHGKGRDYADLHETYQIAILAKKRLYKDRALVHTFQYYDPTHHISLGGVTRLITMELSKTGQFLEKPIEAMDEREAWAVFFQHLTEPDKRAKINEIIKRDEGVAMAGEVLVHISQDERERARLTSELKYILDTRTWQRLAREKGLESGLKKGLKKGLQQGLQKGLEKGLEEGLQKGIEKGLEEGLQKGLKKGLEEGREKGFTEASFEIARKLKAEGVAGTIIAQSTGLTPETVDSL